MNFYGAVPSIVFNNNNYDHSDAAVLGNIETNGNTTLTFDGAAFRGSIDNGNPGVSGIFDTVNIARNFSTSGTITGEQIINVKNAGTVFTINDAITQVDTTFYTEAGTTTNIVTGGDISGAGNINNFGQLTITAPGTIGANGSMAGGIINNSGGTISIDGATITAGGLTNHGTIEMLTPSIIDVGNYTMGDSGIHKVKINNNVASTLTLTNGCVDFGGCSNFTVQINPVNTTLADGQTFVIASGSVAATTIDPANVSVVNLASGSTPSHTYSVTNSNRNVVLTISAPPSPGSSNNQSLASLVYGRNNVIVATVLDGLMSNSGGAMVPNDLNTVLTAINQLNKSRVLVTNAVIQLSPNVGTSQTIKNSFDTPPLIFKEIGNRIEQITRSRIKEVNTGYSAGNGMVADRDLWITGFRAGNNQKEHKNIFGYKASTIGVVAGIDSQVIDKGFIGFSLSYANMLIKAKHFAGNNTRISSYQATWYGSLSEKKYYIDGFASFAYNQYSNDRHIYFSSVNRVARGKFSGMQPSVKIGSGYMYSYDCFHVIPNSSLQYTYLHQQKYNETGAGSINLNNVASKNSQKLEGGLGVKFALWRTENDDFNRVCQDFHFMVFRDFINSNQETTAQLAGGGGNFTIRNSSLIENSYNFGAGLVLIHKGKLHFTVNYDLIKKRKYVGHSGSLAVKLEM